MSFLSYYNKIVIVCVWKSLQLITNKPLDVKASFRSGDVNVGRWSIATLVVIV